MQELDWLSSHSEEVEKYSGKWVAVTPQGIVAFGDSADEVESKLKKKGLTWDDVYCSPRKQPA
ncbi:MAG: hypothetical protein A2Z88_00105 [Omnitrophica WOR_2 bacterium GWA2_47_8]|nr:MAG: hypothetical protein A2Z88_00105 [Omnitrophica WOR_2 bacterium GWA2_47_8]